MVKQYPHYLFVETTTESTQDESGNWSESETTNELIGVCREETDGRGSKIQVSGGEYIYSTSLIQLPKCSSKLENGATVIICNDEAGTDVRVSGVVLKYDVGQLHNRLWI